MTWAWSEYALPLARPYQWAKGVQAERRGLLVSCQAEQTASQGGWGEVAPPPHEQNNLSDLARQLAHLAPRPGDPEQQLRDAPARLRHGLLGAWLDRAAQESRLPLAHFVAQRYGVERTPARRVPVNCLIEATQPTEAAERAAAATRAGFRTLKVKSSGRPHEDVERMRAVREAAGPNARLRLDANESWRPEDALSILHELAPLGIEYVEQPIRAGRLVDLLALVRESPVPIALDESVHGVEAVAPFVAAGCKPTLILKPQRLGGADRCVHLLQWAQAKGLACVVTNSLETAIGRAHALHIAALMAQPIPDCGLATEGHFALDVAPGVKTHGGWQDVPGEPGLGVRPKENLHAAPVA